MSKSFAIDMSSNLKFELSTAQAICSVVDTPRALTVFLLCKYGEFQQLVDLTIDHRHYEDHGNFADDYLVTSIMAKSANLPLGIDLEQKALDSFQESEDSCRVINDRFCEERMDDNPIIRRAKRIISKTLGPLSRRDLDFVQDNFRFGPGATTGVRGSGSVLSDKYDEEIHLTSDLIPFYRAMLGDHWWSEKTKPVVVEGNRFTTVPKNAKTKRGICIEPTLNIYGQLGIGSLLRARLNRLGTDLSDQGANQRMAQRAYKDKLATIDLSAASDSIAWKIVMDLFPEEWFELLDLFRSTHSIVDGKTVELEKFSSMGNGYTFELETLIFKAVALACVPVHLHDDVCVYGDDIIVPQAHAEDVVSALKFLGFKVNESKSFLAGNFFESCGTDWFKGQNVRPFYLRQQSGSKIPYVVQAANALRLYSRRILGDLGCDSRFKDLWVSLYKLAPRTWKNCRVPVEYGDSGFIVSLDESRAKRPQPGDTIAGKPVNGYQGWIVRHMYLAPIKRRKTSLGRLLAALACPCPEIATLGFEPKRGYLRSPVPKRSIVFEWTKGLSWV